MTIRKNPVNHIDPLVRSKSFRFNIKQVGEVNSNMLLNALEHAEYQIARYRDALRRSKAVINRKTATETHLMIEKLLKQTEEQFGKEFNYLVAVSNNFAAK